jgi:hypothetical protein
MGSTNLYPGPAEPTRYLLVWITKLPKESSSGRYRVSIAEITVRVQ